IAALAGPLRAPFITFYRARIIRNPRAHNGKTGSGALIGQQRSMNLDVNTLFLVTIYVEAILGLLLLFVWVQNTSIHAVAWWGFAHLIRAASIVLFGLYGSAPELITIDLANALLFTAFAVTWTGARIFDGRPAEPDRKSVE